MVNQAVLLSICGGVESLIRGLVREDAGHTIDIISTLWRFVIRFRTFFLARLRDALTDAGSFRM